MSISVRLQITACIDLLCAKQLRSCFINYKLYYEWNLNYTRK